MITIMILNQDISRFSTAIQENEEKIKRLRKAKMSIENLREDLINNKKNVFKPEFFSTSWAGKHAKEHSNIRDSIAQSSTYIANQQVGELLNEIDKKIKKLKDKNESLLDSISVKQREISRINNM